PLASPSNLVQSSPADDLEYRAVRWALAGSARMTDRGFVMTGAPFDGQATAAGDRYRALLAVSEAIATHRDLPALFHDLAGRLHPVVYFDYLALVLHEAATDSMRLHVLEPAEPTLVPPCVSDPVSDSPPGLVWQTQQPMIVSDPAELGRWPRFAQRALSFGVH